MCTRLRTSTCLASEVSHAVKLYKYFDYIVSLSAAYSGQVVFTPRAGVCSEISILMLDFSRWPFVFNI